MDHRGKTKEQLVSELKDLQDRVSQLEEIEKTHQQTVAALRALEEKLRTIIERANLGIVVIQDGQRIFYNAKLHEMLGYTGEEYKKVNLLSLVHPEDRALVIDRIRARRTGSGTEPDKSHIRILSKSGEVRWVETNSVRIQWQGRPAVQVFVLDITERKRAEEAYRNLVEHSQQGLSIVQGEHIVFANQALANITGYTIEELLNFSPEQMQGLIHPEDQEFVTERVIKQLSGESVPEKCEFRFTRKDGTERWLEQYTSLIEYNGRPAVQTAYIDITDRKQSEQALRESLQTSDDIVQSIPSGIFIYRYVEPDKLILIDGNPGAEHLTSIRIADWKDREFNDIWPEAREAGITDAYLEVMRTGVMFQTDSLYYEDNNLQDYFRIHAFRIPNHRLVVAFENITPLKRAEESTRHRADQLALLNRVVNQVSGLLDIDEMLEKSTCLIQEAFNYEHVGLFIRNNETNKLVLSAKAGVYASRLSHNHRFDMGQGIVGWAAKYGMSLCVNDVSVEPRFYNPFDEDIITSKLSVPIKHGEAVIGVLDVQSRKTNAFTEVDVTVLETLAGQLAIAIRNAQLFESERQERVLAQTFRRATEAISDFVSVEEALNLVTDLLAEVVRYDRVVLLLVDGETLRPIVVRGSADDQAELNQEYHYSQVEPLYISMSEGSPLIFQKIDQPKSYINQLPALDEETTGWVGIPLVTAEIVIGYLCVSTYRPGGYFPEDTEAIQGFARQAVLAVSRSRLLDELRQTQARLTRVAKLSVAGEIAAGVAHQINNPLTAIVAQSHLLLKSLTPEDIMYQRVEKIRTAAYLASNVVQRMLDFARALPQDMEPLDVNESIQKAVSLVRSQIEPHVAQIHGQYETDLPPIKGSPTHLEDVWINLILNARDAIKGVENAAITIATQLTKDGKLIEIRVEDNGPGISPDKRIHIFEPFFTTKEHGTGLGLSICHEIVSQHGGSIRLDSEEGKGATFIVHLPV